MYQWSCLESSKIRSSGWPVSAAIRPSTVSLVCRRSAACSSTSTAEPPIPADPWCIRMRACGSANRLPCVPAESRNWPALQAMPNASVATSHGMSRMTSRIASIDGTEPPGELIQSAMSACRVLVGEREELGGEQGAVVVVEHAVEDEHAPLEQGEPESFGEDGDLCFLRHASSVRDDRPVRRGSLPSADLLTAARPGRNLGNPAGT